MQNRWPDKNVPAYTFGIGRYAELGVVLMLLAVIAAAVHVMTGITWIPAAGAVLAGASLLGFAAVPSLSRPRATGTRQA
ncbi:hypothetical protein [Mycolicibacterium thermoresistibile]